jgi:hypothetical protein
MRRTLAIGLLCGGLAACAIPLSPPLGPPGDLTADRQACNQTYPPHLGNYLPHAQCVNAAVERDAIPTAHYPDLVRLQEQLRVKYSAQIDQRVISAHQGEQRMAETDELVNAAMHDRDIGRAQMADHRVGRLEAMLQ